MTSVARHIVYRALATISLFAFASCQVARPARLEAAETIAIEQLATNIESYRGRSVKVCGQITRFQNPPAWGIQRTHEPGEITFHAWAAVLVAPRQADPPRLDREGCTVGRIAREDGSLEIPRAVRSTEAPINYEWFLHPDRF